CARHRHAHRPDPAEGRQGVHRRRPPGVDPSRLRPRRLLRQLRGLPEPLPPPLVEREIGADTPGLVPYSDIWRESAKETEARSEEDGDGEGLWFPGSPLLPCLLSRSRLVRSF